jgi:hypothetical protein
MLLHMGLILSLALAATWAAVADAADNTARRSGCSALDTAVPDRVFSIMSPEYADDNAGKSYLSSDPSRLY